MKLRHKIIAGLLTVASIGAFGTVTLAQAKEGPVVVNEMREGTRFCKKCVWVYDPYRGGYYQSCEIRVCYLV